MGCVFRFPSGICSAVVSHFNPLSVLEGLARHTKELRQFEEAEPVIAILAVDEEESVENLELVKLTIECFFGEQPIVVRTRGARRGGSPDLIIRFEPIGRERNNWWSVSGLTGRSGNIEG